jgi:mono/diheme cytochrome c family protein
MSQLALSSLLFLAAAAHAQPARMSAEAQRELVERYCAGCHNDRLKSGGFSLSELDLVHAEHSAPRAEKVVLKLRAGMMPPVGMPRPDRETVRRFVESLEAELDRDSAEHVNPGRPALHRLNRAEYGNSVHDLLDLDIDAAAYLPPDDMSHGFDNMAEVLNVSPALMAGYVRAAGENQPPGDRRCACESSRRDLRRSASCVPDAPRGRNSGGHAGRHRDSAHLPRGRQVHFQNHALFHDEHLSLRLYAERREA